jgi:hypothetical protein
LPEIVTGLRKPRHGNISELLWTQTKDICLFSATPARDDYHMPQIPQLDTRKLLRIVGYLRRTISKRTGAFSQLEIIEAARVVYRSQITSYRATLFQLKTHDRVNYDNPL